MNFYYIIPGGKDGHYVCENGNFIARFDELAKAEALRQTLVDRLAEEYETRLVGTAC